MLNVGSIMRRLGEVYCTGYGNTAGYLLPSFNTILLQHGVNRAPDMTAMSFRKEKEKVLCLAPWIGKLECTGKDMGYTSKSARTKLINYTDCGSAVFNRNMPRMAFLFLLPKKDTEMLPFWMIIISMLYISDGSSNSKQLVCDHKSEKCMSTFQLPLAQVSLPLPH